jgi:uncharacterized protein (DUF885 family)
MSAEDTASALDALYAEFDEEFLRDNPVFATFRGDMRFNDQWFPDDILSDEYLESAYQRDREYLERLQAIDPGGLSDADRSNYEIFKLDRQIAIERHELGLNQMQLLTPVSQFFSVPNFLVLLGSGANAQPFQTPEDYDNWIKRSSGFTGHIDLSIARMREGIESGVVQPRILMEKTLPQLDAQIVESADQSAFWQPVMNMPEDFSDEDRERLTEAYRAHIEDVLVPAYAKLRDFIRDEYLPETRETIGQSDVPGGEALYRWLVRETTTTDYTPEEIHEIGKREAERIYAEIEKVRERVGFEGDMQAFFEDLRTDPQFYFDTPEELMAGYEDLRAKIDPRLGELFESIPETEYVLRPVEEFRAQSMAAAQYFPGTPDGSRPGIFYVNTYDLAARPSYVMEALSLHEANPGHHFQVMLSWELDDMPAFRKFNGYTAFVEGWGLYAESLGPELGMYEDPYQYLGWLFFDIWRANRLVVDTGMHALGWSRQEAIDWMKGNSPMADTDVIAEVDRYIAIPSQALAYKIGQLKIRELRTRAEEALGDAFDVREFHTQVLMTGSLPLFVLEDKIDRWIESKLDTADG